MGYAKCACYLNSVNCIFVKGFCLMDRKRGILICVVFLLVCLAGGALGSSPAGHPGAESSAAIDLPSQVTPLRVVAFYSSTCQHCEKAKKALAESERRWGSRVRVEKLDSPANFAKTKWLNFWEKAFCDQSCRFSSCADKVLAAMKLIDF